MATKQQQEQVYSAFISHAADDREIANSIREQLEKSGFRCWIAPRDVRPGQDYPEEIVRGIEASKCLVLVLSSKANESKFVKAEVERAYSKGKPVFPVRIEEVVPVRGLELFISTKHWIDAWDGNLIDHTAALALEIARDEQLDIPLASEVIKRFCLRKYSRLAASLGGALLIAVVVATMMKPDTGDDTNAQQQVMEKMEKIGIPGLGEPKDLNKLSGDDLKINTDYWIDYGKSPKWRVTLGFPVSYANTDLQAVRFYYSLDSDNFFPIAETMSAYVNFFVFEIRDAATAKTLYLRLKLPDGNVLGPFSYDVDFYDVALKSLKQRALRSDRWVWGCRPHRPGGLRVPSCSLGLGDVFPAIVSIKYGPSMNQLIKEIAMPRVSEVALNGSLWGPGKQLSSIKLESRWRTVYAQLVFVDGETSDIRSFNARP